MSYLYYARGISLVSNGLLAGLGPCMNFISVPSIKASRNPARVWAVTYDRGKYIAISNILVSSLSHFYIYYKTRATKSLVCGVLSFVLAPWTLVAMKPTNDRLQALADSESNDTEIRQLINTWEKLQWFRTVAGLTAFVLNVFY